MDSALDELAAEITAIQMAPQFTTAQVDAMYARHSNVRAVRALFLVKAVDDILAAHHRRNNAVIRSRA